FHKRITIYRKMMVESCKKNGLQKMCIFISNSIYLSRTHVPLLLLYLYTAICACGITSLKK
ncbi:conserved hypothetical protein, partial [Trichinella spiralis]|uniref:hypothetical protein n=1 Tax=Trichinella spiralis TaxID=6334 RepID=UPI0001EFED3B